MDQSLKNIIINRITLLKDKESAALRREVDRLKSDAASRGFPAMPGHTQAQIVERYKQHLSNLPQLIVQEMRDILLKFQPEPSQELSTYLKNLISSHCAISSNSLQNSLALEGIDPDIA